MASIRQRKKKQRVLGNTAFTFLEIRYNMAVLFRNQASLNGPKISADVVIGRAVGMRSDGQCFYASVDLPWVWNKKPWNWQMIARERVRTFLLDTCQCWAKGAEERTCPMHVELRRKWVEEDRKKLESTRRALDTAPKAGTDSGPALTHKVMHQDYPWCLFEIVKKRFMCDICKGEQDAYSNNPTYRNQFILRHSHCGFPAAGYEASLAATNLSTYSEVCRELDAKVKSIQMKVKSLQTAADRLVQLRLHATWPGTLGDYLPERMSLDEAVEFLQKKDERKLSPDDRTKLLEQ